MSKSFQLSNYEIQETLSSTTHETIFLAKKLTDNTLYTLREINQKESKANTQASILSEAYTLSCLHHPNIIALKEYSAITQDKVYIVIEHIDGKFPFHLGLT